MKSIKTMKVEFWLNAFWFSNKNISEEEKKKKRDNRIHETQGHVQFVPSMYTSTDLKLRTESKTHAAVLTFDHYHIDVDGADGGLGEPLSPL